MMLAVQLILLSIAAAVLTLLGRRGVLSPRVLRAGPDRAFGLRPADLLVAIGLMLIGSSLLPFAKAPWPALSPEPDQRLPATIAATLAALLLAQLFVQGPPLAYFLWRTARAGAIRRMGLAPTQPAADLRVGLIALAAALPLVLATMALTTLVRLALGQPSPEIAHALLPIFQQGGQPIARIGLILAVTVTTPIIEETLFRGFVQSAIVEMLGNDRRAVAIAIVATLFALIHVSAVPWHALPALFVLAVILGWLYERTGSIWPSIVVHAGFNAFNVALALAYYSSNP